MILSFWTIRSSICSSSRQLFQLILSLRKRERGNEKERERENERKGEREKLVWRKEFPSFFIPAWLTFVLPFAQSVFFLPLSCVLPQSAVIRNFLSHTIQYEQTAIRLARLPPQHVYTSYTCVRNRLRMHMYALLQISGRNADAAERWLFTLWISESRGLTWTRVKRALLVFFAFILLCGFAFARRLVVSSCRCSANSIVDTKRMASFQSGQSVVESRAAICLNRRAQTFFEKKYMCVP